ncbi:class I SAM-dependent methyltransferase [Streptomyces sp. HO565]|uniref:class I SAM-dependent methyltransferase n=1 Tax=Streptomyces sp. HO565 TaxID=2857489 RepID=UPI0038B499D8
MTSTGTPYPACGAASYGEPVRRRGRRHRAVDGAESEAMRRHLGAGRGRPALDIGCGEGELTAHLDRLGHRATGIDCSPTAAAAARERRPGLDLRAMASTSSSPAGCLTPPSPSWRAGSRTAGPPTNPPFCPGCRRLLAPGGVFRVVTSLHASGQGPPRSWDAGTADVERLTARWSRARVSELEPSFRCYALRP